MRIRLSSCFFIALLAFSTVATALGEPMFGASQTFPQPDGSKVTVLLYGDEFYMRAETEDGFTVVRDPQTGWICYARANEDGSELVSTGVRYTGRTNSNAQSPRDQTGKRRPRTRHADLSLTNRLQRARSTKARLLDYRPEHSGEAIPAPALSVSQAAVIANEPAVSLPPRRPDVTRYRGHVNGIVLLFDFPEEPAGESPTFEEYENSVNLPDFHKPDGRANSLRTYFDEVSAGTFVLSNYVFGIFRATNTFAWYDSLGYGEGARLLLAQGLAQVKASGFDFSRLSVDENQQVRGLSLMYSGSPRTWARGMWFHAGFWSTGPTYDGVSFRRYCTTRLSTDPRTLIHEHGHLSAGWPDLYSYNGVGTGIWDVMSGLGTELPNPYLLYQNGWLDATNIRGIYGPRAMDSLNPHQAAVYYDPDQPNEFFFLRPYTRDLLYCAGIPDEGLSIWRINALGDNSSFPNTDLQIEMVHADGVLDDNCEQPLFKDADRNTFTDQSAPSSLWRYHAHKGQRSGLNLTGIGAPGQTMSFRTSRPIYFYPMDEPVTAPGASVNLKATAVCDLPFTYAAAGLPPGLGIDPTTGSINGTPASAGTYSVSISATASDGSQNVYHFRWVIGSQPTALSFSPVADQLTYVGQTVSYPLRLLRGSDAQFSADGLPAGLVINPLTGVISGTVMLPGIYDVSVRAASQDNTQAVARFTLGVVSNVVPPVPVAWYPLATNAIDISGGRNGTLAGAPVFAFPGVQLDGEDDCIVIPRPVSEDFSISFFVNTGVSGPETGSLWYNGAGLVDGDAPGLMNDFGITLLGNRVSFGVGSPFGDSTVTSTNTVTDRFWHHVCATRRSADGEMTVYIDGRPDSVGSGTTGPKTATAFLKIGSLQTGRNYFQGGLADVKLYDYVLGAEDIFRESKTLPAEPGYRITQVISSQSGCTMTWQSTPGEVYQVEWSRRPGEGFVPVGAPVVTGNAYNVTRTVPLPLEDGFFRIRRL